MYAAHVAGIRGTINAYNILAENHVSRNSFGDLVAK
jgi:hypothetical protein